MTYLPLGFHHIIGLAGLDHLLFIVVLCAAYSWRAWRRILLVLTGFTLGHSLTLALTALHIVVFPARVVEVLIPLTILAAGLGNVALPRPEGVGWPLLVATLFGLVHGCGFAGYFTMMLGDEERIVGPLFGFNVGLELGQMATVAVLYAVFFMVEKIQPLSLRSWTLFVSGAGAGVALKMLLETLFAV